MEAISILGAAKAVLLIDLLSHVIKPFKLDVKSLEQMCLLKFSAFVIWEDK